MYTAGAGAIWGMYATSQQLKAQNKAIEAEIQRNQEIYKAQEVMTKFAQDNNDRMAQEIQIQLFQEQQVAQMDISVDKTKAVSTEVVRRGSGITAGISAERSVDAIIKAGEEAKNKVLDQYDVQKAGVYAQKNDANAREQIGLIQGYNNMVNQNITLAGKVIRGKQAAMMIVGAGVSGGASGYSMGSSLEKAFTSAPLTPVAVPNTTPLGQSSYGPQSLAPQPDIGIFQTKTYNPVKNVFML